MRYQSGERFSTYNDGVTTASFALTAATRDVLIEKINACSITSDAFVTVQASGSTIWMGRIGSACSPVTFDVWLENAGAATLSCNVNGSASSSISVVGIYRLL